ncbi:MAG: HEAT repeat domain-containing protein [Candidatus Omnitrophica bacterium]|nr:HEAT repeat domain-containing protein [Candidatus Omnitrophota bacterium]
MNNYHIDFIWQLNKFLIAASFFMSAFIIVYVVSKGFLLRRRIRHLVLLKKRLEAQAASPELSVQDKCDLFIDRIDPLEAAEVISNKKLVYSEKLNSELKACFISKNKIRQIEKIALSSRNKWRRIQAIISLGTSGDPSALQVIESCLSEKDEDISYFSMLALGQLKIVPAATALLNYLGKHIYSGNRIVSLLEDYPEVITTEVIKATQSPDPFVRFWCVKLLAKFKPVEYLSRIVELTQDSSADVRAAGCECLGNIGSVQAKDALARCLKDEAWFVRMHAVRALAKILKSECVTLVKPLLEDKELLVRESAKCAILVK